MAFEKLLVLACVFMEGFIGTIPTILMISLMFGLVFACVWLTCMVLWQGMTWAATRTAWHLFKTAKRYIKMKLKEYFAHLHWWGLTKESCASLSVSVLLRGFWSLRPSRSRRIHTSFCLRSQ